MERPAGDDGVEQTGLRELLERDAAKEEPVGRLRVDRGHDVAGGRERPRQLTAAAADLEHARRCGRKLGEDELLDVHASRQSCTRARSGRRAGVPG
jgi:hypothetical protein